MDLGVPFTDMPSRNPPIDLGEFPAWMSRATPEQKEAAIFKLLRDRLGPRVQEEYGVFAPNGFQYAVVICPGLREAFRMLEDPERAERFRQSSLGPTTPSREIWKELGMDMTEFE